MEGLRFNKQAISVMAKISFTLIFIGFLSKLQNFIIN